MLTDKDFTLENASRIDYEAHLKHAHEMRSAYLADIFSDMVHKVAEVCHLKHSHHDSHQH